MSDDERTGVPPAEPGGMNQEPPAAQPAAVPPQAPPPPPPAPTHAAPVASVQVPGYAPPAPAGPPPYGPPPPRYGGPVPPGGGPRRRASTGWIIAVLIVLGFVTFLVLSFLVGGTEDGPSIGLSRVGVITIEGVIRDGGRGGLFSGPAGARGIMKQLREAANDSDTKSVLLLINSPGGSPAASHAIWEEINKLKTRKQVVVCMTDVCASGGYYIASAANRIVADGSTLTGSIGVIMGGLGYWGLMQKLGLTDQTLTAGKFKDVGSGKRPMTPEERAYLSAMLQDVYGQFIAAVAQGRKLPAARVRRLAEGRIYTGNQAKAVGLVDDIGNYYDALKIAAKLGGITGEPRVKNYGEAKGLLGQLAGAEGLLHHAFGAHSAFDELPLQGPMLMMPYTYQMVPVVRGEVFDLK